MTSTCDQSYSWGVYMTEVPGSTQVGMVDCSKNSIYIYTDHFTVDNQSVSRLTKTLQRVLRKTALTLATGHRFCFPNCSC